MRACATTTATKLAAPTKRQHARQPTSAGFPQEPIKHAIAHRFSAVEFQARKLRRMIEAEWEQRSGVAI